MATPTAPGNKLKELQTLGQMAFNRVEKVNAELFALTYGAIVTQLLKDYEQVEEVNTQLEKMCVAIELGGRLTTVDRGYNIGVRLIDEFLARSGVPRCQKDIKETADVIAKVCRARHGPVPDALGWLPHVP